MKAYVVMYYDYDGCIVDKVYSSEAEAHKYTDTKNKEIDELDGLRLVCKNCEDNDLSHKNHCVYANIKNDRYGLYCENSYKNISDYGKNWSVIEKDIE